jgi:hypothetical protein
VGRWPWSGARCGGWGGRPRAGSLSSSMTGEGGTSLDARAAALVGGSHGLRRGSRLGCCPVVTVAWAA